MENNTDENNIETNTETPPVEPDQPPKEYTMSDKESFISQGIKIGKTRTNDRLIKMGLDPNNLEASFASLTANPEQTIDNNDKSKLN